MSNPPDYWSIDPPAETDPADYSTHERRAAILEEIIEAGTPAAINQRRMAALFEVHESTESRDMDQLRETINDRLGNDAKLTTKTLVDHVVSELIEADDWRASARAWDIVIEWNRWLADVGAQDREPRKSAVDVELTSNRLDVAYQVIRPSDADALPRTEDGEIDYAEIGFSEGPGAVDIPPMEDPDDE